MHFKDHYTQNTLHTCDFIGFDKTFNSDSSLLEVFRVEWVSNQTSQVLAYFLLLHSALIKQKHRTGLALADFQRVDAGLPGLTVFLCQ